MAKVMAAPAVPLGARREPSSSSPAGPPQPGLRKDSLVGVSEKADL